MSLLAPAFRRPDDATPETWVDSDQLARAPRLPSALTEGLPGRCRGALLQDWVDNLEAQWGDGVTARVREGLGSMSALLPDAPSALAWYPVGAQLRVTEVLLDEVVDRDPQALKDVLMALLDGHRAAHFLARRMGLKRLIPHVSSLFAQCYDQGRVEARVSGRHGVVTMGGSDMVTHPTWQLLQLVGYEVLAELAGERRASVEGRIGSGRLFEVHVRW